MKYSLQTFRLASKIAKIVVDRTTVGTFVPFNNEYHKDVLFVNLFARSDGCICHSGIFSMVFTVDSDNGYQYIDVNGDVRFWKLESLFDKYFTEEKLEEQ